MAISTTLLKLNGTEFPLKWIAVDSYSVTYSTIDLDSYRDADGVLHRTALNHKVGKIEFNTPILKQSEALALIQFIGSRLSTVEKKVSVTFFNPELCTCTTQVMYMPDITFKIMQNSPEGFIYQPTRIAFIGY